MVLSPLLRYQMALETGAPVVWMDSHAPDKWRMLYGPEALAGVHVHPGEDAGRATIKNNGSCFQDHVAMTVTDALLRSFSGDDP
jgi:hypothetical protein